MATNPAIEPELLEAALALSKLPTKKATVNEALREFIQRRRQLKAIEGFGTIKFDPNFDYKEQRRRQ